MRALCLIALLAHEASAKPVTCKDLEYAHQEAESSTGTFYNKALAAHSLSPILHTRDVWIVPTDLTYRGEIEIAYEARTLDIKIIDQNCPLPP